MTDQLRINNRGELEWMIAHARTWDDEPMWSVDTAAEALFDPEPFEQLLGQTAMEAGDGDKS